MVVITSVFISLYSIGLVTNKIITGERTELGEDNTTEEWNDEKWLWTENMPVWTGRNESSIKITTQVGNVKCSNNKLFDCKKDVWLVF